MRNYKFKISAMFPSQWFQKLKNMTKSRKKHPLPSCSLNTTKKTKTSSESIKSLPHSSRPYFSSRSHTSLESKKILHCNSPRNSLHVIESKRKTVYKPSPPSSSVSAGFNKKKINFLPTQDSSSSSASSNVNDMSNRDFKKRMLKEMKVFDTKEKACPASNRTKAVRTPHHLSLKIKNKEEARRNQKKHQRTSGRRSSANSPRIKLKVSSPRVQVSARRSKSRSQSKQVLDSVAVIKSSLDPKKDFRESMVEMIEENNIRASQDLRELLACYLSLNPKEYHDLILEVFVQVWLEVINSKVSSK